LDQERICELENELKAAEDDRNSKFKEYFSFRQNAVTYKENLNTFRKSLESGIETFKSNVHSRTSAALNDMKESERLAELRSNDLAERCRQKAMKGDEEIFVLKEQYTALQSMY